MTDNQARDAKHTAGGRDTDVADLKRQRQEAESAGDTNRVAQIDEQLGNSGNA